MTLPAYGVRAHIILVLAFCWHLGGECLDFVSVEDAIAYPRHNHTQIHVSHPVSQLRMAYLQLLRDTVSGTVLATPGRTPLKSMNVSSWPIVFDAVKRKNGEDFPLYGVTMVGALRLRNIEHLWIEVFINRVDGDFIECGVWRGGSSIFARGVLKAFNVLDRTVHLVDSFQGLPRATSAEDSDSWSVFTFLQVSLEQVQENFRRFGLLDAQVQFHRGFFRYSLPRVRAQFLAEGRRIAILRMDGDMYESTMDQLFLLYDLVSIRGYIIVDDWRISACQRAVVHFLDMHGIGSSTTMVRIDLMAAYFQKTTEVAVNMTWYTAYNNSRRLETADRRRRIVLR